MEKLKNYKELADGGIIDKPATTKDYYTGSWRTEKPIWNEAKCTHCMFCWVYCPDSAIEVADKKMTGINYHHCKGCALCAWACPAKPNKAIKMEKETEKIK